MRASSDVLSDAAAEAEERLAVVGHSPAHRGSVRPQHGLPGDLVEEEPQTHSAVPAGEALQSCHQADLGEEDETYLELPEEVLVVPPAFSEPFAGGGRRGPFRPRSSAVENVGIGIHHPGPVTENLAIGL